MLACEKGKGRDGKGRRKFLNGIPHWLVEREREERRKR
jgi:hypothetical protein